MSQGDLVSGIFVICMICFVTGFGMTYCVFYNFPDTNHKVQLDIDYKNIPSHTHDNIPSHTHDKYVKKII